MPGEGAWHGSCEGSVQPKLTGPFPCSRTQPRVGTDRFRDSCSDPDEQRRRITSMSHLLSDLRLAVRLLLRDRVFTGVAVLTLALGIGATTAVFSVVYQVMLQPLPYADS